MSCSLCQKKNIRLIQFNSNEATKQQIPAIVFKHLPFCFNDEPREGSICKKCWPRVNAFHKFYVQIEQIFELTYKTEVIERIEEEIVIVNESLTEEQPIEIEEIKEIEKIERIEPCDDFTPEVIDDLSLENDFNGFYDDSDGFDDEPNSPSDSNREPSNKNPKRRKKHNKKHNPVLTKCAVCKKTVPQYTYKAHQKQQHPDYPFRCYASCPSMFKTAELFQQHKLEKHKSKCNICRKIVSAVNMPRHIRLQHDKPKKEIKIICHTCGRVFKDPYALKYHIRAEHEVHERLQCDICKEWSKNIETLRAHMRAIHVQKPQTCDICGRVSTNSKSLAKHKKIHLEGAKDRFKCICCGRGFADRTKLKEHSYIHSGITDAYLCQFCGKGFRFGSSLSAHRMKYHPAEMAQVKNRLERKKNLEFKV